MRKKNCWPVLLLTNDIKIQSRIIQCNYSQNLNRWGFLLLVYMIFGTFLGDSKIYTNIQKAKNIKGTLKEL